MESSAKEQLRTFGRVTGRARGIVSYGVAKRHALARGLAEKLTRRAGTGKEIFLSPSAEERARFRVLVAAVRTADNRAELRSLLGRYPGYLGWNFSIPGAIR